MRKRLQLKTKNKVKLKTSVKLTIAGAAFAVTLALGFFVFDYLTRPETGKAGAEKSLPGYAFRRKVQLNISPNKSNVVFNDFPILVRLKHPDLKHIQLGGKVTHKAGYDIRFTKPDGTTILNTQIEQYNPQDGSLTAWVLLDSLAPGKAPELMLYYSNSSIQNEQANLMWTGDYAAVWHLNRDLNGSSGTARLKANTSGTLEAEGMVAKGRQFNAFNGDFADYGFSEAFQMGDAFSICAWVNLRETGREQVILSSVGDGPGGFRLSISKNGLLDFGFVNAAGTLIRPESTNGAERIAANEWTHIAATYSKSKGEILTYVNGIIDRTFAVKDVPVKNAAALVMGRDKFVEGNGLNGLLDEVRVLHKVLPQSWLAAEYLSQGTGNSIATLFAEESLKIDQASAKQNKAATQAQNEAERSRSAERNRTQATKSNDGEAPTTISSSAQNMRDRMNSIRRVSTENSKP
jgi:hypothetical protein